ncbi:hypothetical protein AX16_008288 [Volvariella volvacea WC 439]|nr:hypothetical protein AX16_008288 [Volvariella volvacea WC 439]
MDSPPPPSSSPPTSTPTPAPTPAPAIITSPFPDPPPASVPTTNAHNVFFNRPEQALWPDFTLQIDAATGARRTYREFVERVRDVGSVLAAGREKGGLGLGSGEEIVGILSDNSMASHIPYSRA